MLKIYGHFRSIALNDDFTEGKNPVSLLMNYIRETKWRPVHTCSQTLLWLTLSWCSSAQDKVIQMSLLFTVECVLLAVCWLIIRFVCFQVFLFCFGGLFVFWEVTSRVSSIVSTKSSLRFKVALLLTQFSLWCEYAVLKNIYLEARRNIFSFWYVKKE